MGEAEILPSQWPPFIEVEGVSNFRGVGDYLCSPPVSSLPPVNPIGNDSASAWCIRPGILFRSAQPSQITPAGLEILTNKLSIKAIFDFRSEKDILLVTERFPDALLDIPGTTRYSVPVYQEQDQTPGSLAERYEATSVGLQKQEDSERGFVKAYCTLARAAAKSGSFRTILQYMLQNPESPILVHCTVGKDRTGVFVALILSLCGVPSEAIAIDYSLTSQGLGVWREYLVKRLLQKGEVKTREQAEYILGSHKEDMLAFLRFFESEFGGARRYFIEMCGFQDSELDRIVASMVVQRGE